MDPVLLVSPCLAREVQGMSLVSAPDRWSFTSWFSAFGAEDYLAFKAAISSDLANMLERAGAETNLPLLLKDLEALTDRVQHLGSYLGCLSADDANDEAVKKDEAWFSTQEAQQVKIMAVVRGRLAKLPAADFETLLQAPETAGAEHAVRRLRQAGLQQMEANLEALAADLNVDGLHAWGRLYDTLSGKMSFTMTFPDGHLEEVPMARRRALMSEPDRALREAAFRDGQKPWLDHADTLAAALNGISGTRLSLYQRRGVEHFLDAPLFDGALSRATIDAMLAAIHQHIELPRRAMRVAARLQGTEALHYFDIEAPQVAAPAEESLSWLDACRSVDTAFTAAYPALGSYFRDMLKQEWVEAQPRAGKRPGAFCTGSNLLRQERVYMNWHGTVHDMVTLAHEVGHAWHSCVLRPQRSYAIDYPMTLAETASNFGEMILLNGLMADPNLAPGMKAYLLDQEMLRAHAYLVNIPMRYEFEKAFYTERAQGEVSAARLSELMSQAQRRIYGDTLLPGGEDPMFWASKMHFFITGVSFYNFPYVFGYLLSQALFARFKAEGPSFLPRYEAFLSATGSASCEAVAKQTLGADLATVDFWADAIASMEPSLLEYEKLA
jgi:oligoendopeptidase F